VTAISDIPAPEQYSLILQSFKSEDENLPVLGAPARDMNEAAHS
jgi:hypothetical protein